MSLHCKNSFQPRNIIICVIINKYIYKIRGIKFLKVLYQFTIHYNTTVHNNFCPILISVCIFFQGNIVFYIFFQTSVVAQCMGKIRCRPRSLGTGRLNSNTTQNMKYIVDPHAVGNAQNCICTL